MPKKLPRPFGHFRFTKRGTITKEIFRLSDKEDQQEREAMDRFVQLHNAT